MLAHSGDSNILESELSQYIVDLISLLCALCSCRSDCYPVTIGMPELLSNSHTLRPTLFLDPSLISAGYERTESPKLATPHTLRRPL